MADKFETLDPDDDELENEEGDDDEEEEEEQPRARGVGAPAVSIPAVAQAARTQRRRGAGSSHKGQEIRKRGRIPQDATRPTQADLLWLDILRRNELIAKGIGAEHFSIRVARLDQGQEVTLGSIDGARCAGDGSSDDSPADTLWNILIDEFHWHSSKGMPATYLLRYTFKRGGGIYDQAKIRLPSNQEIAQMRSAGTGLGRQQGAPQYQGQPPPYGQQQGYQQPPPYGQPYYPPYPPYPGFGAPGPYGAPGFGAIPVPAPSSGDEVTDLREQVRTLTEMVRDMWRYPPQHQPSGYPQGYGPQGLGQPQAPPQLPLSALGELQQVLTPFGLTIAAKQGPQQTTAIVPAASGFQQGLGQLKELAVGVSALKEVADALNGVFQGPAPAVAEDKPEPDFEMVEVPGSKWPNGEPIRYARDDKGINWFGTAMSNGYAMDKFGGAIAGIGKKIVSQINKEQGLGALEEEEEEEEEETPPQQQQAVVTPPPQNPPPQRLNGAHGPKSHDDGFSL